jgi:hypothetical protein
MKLDINCEEHKPSNKNGVKDKCHCKYLNRNFKKHLKVYFSLINSLDKKKR